MRSLWILPDRQQTGEIMVQDGHNLIPLSAAVPLSLLPPALTLGIPEEVLRRFPAGDFVFGQFAKIDKDTSLFCLSIKCGCDMSGRGVAFTLLQWLQAGEKPEPPKLSGRFTDFESETCAQQLLEAWHTSRYQAWIDVREMLNVAAQPGPFRTFASTRLYSTANLPDWAPGTVPPRKSLFFLMGLLAAAFFVAVSTWFSP